MSDAEQYHNAIVDMRDAFLAGGTYGMVPIGSAMVEEEM